MVVVTAFGTLANTTDAGLTAYFRATGCTSLTIADVIPLFSTITAYTEQFVIGELKEWDTGSESAEPNNCAMVRVMVYADGWIVAWFDKETTDQLTVSPCSWVDDQTLYISAGIAYQDQWNSCLLEITTSTDPDCPTGTFFCVREANYAAQTIKVHQDRSADEFHFNTGYQYDIAVRQSNGNLVWWGHSVYGSGSPDNLSNRLYRAIYEMWDVLRYSSNATAVTDTAITKAFLDDGGAFTDYTTECNDAAANDFPLMPATEAIGDAAYFGYANKCAGLNLNIGTAGVGGTIVWEYWNGSAWASLSVTDNTTGYTVAGTNTVIAVPPDDWTKTTVNASEQFWIRTRVTVAGFTTQPLLTQGWCRVPDALAYTDTNLGMYSFEYTSALYCLLCGISEYIGYHESASKSRYFYNTALLTKTIYSHAFNYGYQYLDTSGYGFSYGNEFFINGLKIHDHASSSSDYDSDGYIIQNIESIDTAVGSQNVFSLWYGASSSGVNANKHYVHIASVIITS